MKNGVRVEMDQFDLVVDKKVAEEITGWVSKSALEEGGEHHGFIGVVGWNVLTSGRAPLQHLAVKEKEARNECGCEVAWQGKKAAVSAERLRKKWWQRKR
jgi:FAD/FMN-containing dehydrogenase